jgi:hypothetical protein
VQTLLLAAEAIAGLAVLVACWFARRPMQRAYAMEPRPAIIRSGFMAEVGLFAYLIAILVGIGLVVKAFAG